MANNYTAQFKVKPGERIRLKGIDPSFHGRHKSRKEAARELADRLEKIDDLQYRMWAEKKHSLLVVLQGFDSAGKDSLVRHVFAGLNPQGCTVAHFAEPTPEESAHDFLWRVHARVPSRGMITIFNRSHYEDVLIVRVHKLAPKPVWEARFQEINDFERLLTAQNNTTILKFFLYISKEEQLDRFAKRLDDPYRNWKISESDYTERSRWDDYTVAFEDVFYKTSKELAPWFIIPSNHKWFCHLAVSQIILKAMNAMEIKMPKPTVDLKDIRRKYHAAKKI
jgi:PPK2 family polyphosphate:nucleotide phosphotransferase